MLTALVVAMVVTCKPYHPVPPPPQVTVRCEGADQVRRDVSGRELSRAFLACTQVRCEGTDQVRRDGSGLVIERRFRACVPPTPVRLTTQPGWKFGLSGRG
jgi:hypothetical protein